VQSTAFESTLPKVKSLSCFFSPSLLRAHKNGNWEVVMKTGQRLNLSAIDYLLIPINQNNVHWTQASLSCNEKALRFYDSTGGNGGEILKLIVNYFSKLTNTPYKEWQIEIMENIPRQNNSYDCGVDVCQYAYCISRAVAFNFKQKDMFKIRRIMQEELATGQLYDRQLTSPTPVTLPTILSPSPTLVTPATFSSPLPISVTPPTFSSPLSIPVTPPTNLSPPPTPVTQRTFSSPSSTPATPPTFSSPSPIPVTPKSTFMPPPSLFPIVAANRTADSYVPPKKRKIANDRGQLKNEYRLTNTRERYVESLREKIRFLQQQTRRLQVKLFETNEKLDQYENDMADQKRKTIMVEKLQDRRANKEMMAILLLNQVRDKRYNFCNVLKFLSPIFKQAENMLEKNHLGDRGDSILHNSSC
jgi:sentrin-specific protease 1